MDGQRNFNRTDRNRGVVFIGAVIMEKRKIKKTIGDCNEAYNAWEPEMQW